MRKIAVANVALRVLLAAIFIYASWDKILHPKDFAAVVRDYRILPDILVNIPAIILPWLELMLGLLLLVGQLREGTLLLVNALLITFWITLVVNYFRGIDVGCGCFSTTREESSPMLWYLFRDGLFVVLALGAAWVHWARLRGSGMPSPSVTVNTKDERHS